MTQRWAFIRHGQVRLTRLSETLPGMAETLPMLPAGDTAGGWQTCPADCGEDWRLAADGQWLSPPASPRMINGADFLGLFTSAEVATLWASGPEFMTAALRVAAQNEANLDSPEFSALLSLAVSRGALSGARRSQIAAGQPAR